MEVIAEAKELEEVEVIQQEEVEVIEQKSAELQDMLPEKLRRR